MKKLLLIINPVAGRQTSKTAMFDVINTFCKAGYSVTTAITQRRGHASELAHSAKASRFDLVVCMGGDGTLNETITGLCGKNPLPLGYIPAGSTNDFADTLGISTDPLKAAARIAQESPFSLDIGSFTQIADNSSVTRNFSYIASFGAFSAASYSAPQQLKNSIGHLAYILQGIKDIGDIKAHKVSYVADGTEYSGNYIFGSVSNTTSVAGIVKLKKIVDLSDGLFEVIMVRKPANPRELNEILTGIAKSDFSSPMFDFHKSESITLSMGKSIPWTLDGEKADGAAEIHIRNLHNAITLYK